MGPNNDLCPYYKLVSHKKMSRIVAFYARRQPEHDVVNIRQWCTLGGTGKGPKAQNPYKKGRRHEGATRGGEGRGNGKKEIGTQTEKIKERPEAIAGGDNFRGDNSGKDDGREKGRGGTRREEKNMVIVEDEKRSENMSVFITPNSERYCWRRS